MSSENAGGPSVLTTAEDTTRGVRVHADDTASAYGLGRTKVTLITTKSVEVTDSGTVFFLDLVGGFTVTLPTLAQVLAMEGGGGGFWCKFIVKTAPTTAYIITEDGSADTNKIIGSLSCNETTTGTPSDYSAGCTFVNFVASAAVVGDWALFETDGVNWYVSGNANVYTGMTLT